MLKVYGSQMKDGERIHYGDKTGVVMSRRGEEYLIYFDDLTKGYVPISLCYYIKDKKYKSQAARDAQAQGYGKEGYWDYLDSSAEEKHAYYMNLGDRVNAELMFTRSLSDALRGNEGI